MFLLAAKLIMIGIFAGTIGTLIGAGGGFFVIPYLIIFEKFSPALAAGTSLGMVLFNSISGTIAYHRQKRIDFATGIKFAIATIPGAIAGSFLVKLIPSKTFHISFGILLFLVSLYMFLKPETLSRDKDKPLWGIPYTTNRQFTDAFGKEYDISYNVYFGIGISFFVGFLSSSLGIGGGIIHVPAMTLALNFPIHLATATSTFILLITSFTGSFSHYYNDNVFLKYSLFLGLGAIIGAQVGAKIAPKVKGRLLSKIVAVVFVITAIRMLLL
jgi:uncharacterized protein